jgi:large subunit ribosomal protein L22
MPATAENPTEVRAQAKTLRMSAQKARVVLAHIRGKTVAEARTILAFTPRAAATDIELVLRSAAANAEANHGFADADSMVILHAYADEGATLKRWRARARGRVNRINKRTCHITIVIGENPKAGAAPRRAAAQAAAEAAPTSAAGGGKEKPSTPARKRTPKKKEAAV